jgi:alkaline phosphatase D
MTLMLHRRQLLAAGTFGIGALATPGAAQILAARGFTHNVASGEPGHYKVMLWTRYVAGAGDSARLRWQVARTPDFARDRRQRSGQRRVRARLVREAGRRGLAPGTWYFLSLHRPRRRHSPVGGPDAAEPQVGPTDRFTMGVFSCSNLPFGWFNAYAHAAARDDIDLMVHLGDYLYEYERGKYPDTRGRHGRPGDRTRQRNGEPRRLPPAPRLLPRRSRSPASPPALPDGDDVGRS